MVWFKIMKVDGKGVVCNIKPPHLHMLTSPKKGLIQVISIKTYFGKNAAQKQNFSRKQYQIYPLILHAMTSHLYVFMSFNMLLLRG